MYAPIVIYTYNRIEHLKRTVNSLKKNFLAKDSTLIIISDGCGRLADEQSIIDIRNYINSINGFKEVIAEFRESNYGAIKSILEAEMRLVNLYGKIISMEDDNVCSLNFLDFMNQALDYFKDDSTIFSISGYCPPVFKKSNEIITSSDYFINHWNLSWGYGIWREKYNKLYEFDNNYKLLQQNGVISKINRLGGRYIVDALRRDIKYNSDFPDAWLCAKMTYFGYSSIVPSISKVNNIGSDGSGHHKGTLASKFDVVLDDGVKRFFDFDNKPILEINAYFIKQMVKFYNGSIPGRIARYFRVYHYVLIFKKMINGK